MGIPPVTHSYIEQLWALSNWRSIYTGASVLLYVDRILVSSKQVGDREEAESIARAWQRSVRDLIVLEQEAERLD